MNNLEYEAQQLKARFEKIAISRAKFARDFNVPGGDAMIYQHINGLKPISLDAALAYAQGFKCTLAEISKRLSDKISPYVEQASAHEKEDIRPIIDSREQANTEPATIKGYVPLISWVTAGKFCNVENPYEVGDAEEWVACPVKHSSKTYALRVIGDSMLNPSEKHSFKTGDIIFVDPEREYVHRSLVILRLEDENQATFKRLLIDGERRMLEALNPSWPDRIIEITGNATICGVVVAKTEILI